MSKSLKIAIILPDTLQSVGLRSLLADYFLPVEISFFPSYNTFIPSEKDFFDFYFITPDIFVVHSDFFLQKRTKTICVMKEGTPPLTSALTKEELCFPHLEIERVNSQFSTKVLQSNLSQEEIVEKLRAVFQEAAGRESLHSVIEKELSAREKDVLQLVVKGMINKEIADNLCISLNTVLTHRKNITSKLGIKTIPGLTFYAIANGITEVRG